MSKSAILLLGVLLLAGCDLLREPPVDDGTEPPPPAVTSRRVAEHAIRAHPSGRHVATIRIWMDEGPAHPRLVLEAVEALEYYELHLALPSCYVFPRPHGEMPAWRGNRLSAGQRVEIGSTWERVSQNCGSNHATVRWDLASSSFGSRDQLSVLWEWPAGE